MEYTNTHDLAALFVEKRLGKTPLAIRWALARHGVRNILVVAPKSAIPGWLKELKSDGQHGYDLTTEECRARWLKVVCGPNITFAVINAQQLFLPRGRTGDRQPSPTEVALFAWWDAVIWDESRVLANPQSQTSKVANACFRSISNRCILSGEYAPEGPEDIFGQMCWAFGSFMGETNYYRWIFKNFVKDGYDLYPKPGMLEQIKKEVHRLCFILSRKDAGIGEVKHFDERYCELPSKLHKVYDHAERWWEINNESPIEMLGKALPFDTAKLTDTKYAPVAHNWLRQIAGGSPKHFPQLQSTHKLKLLWEVLDEYRYESVVVSFKFNAEMFAAHEFLERKGIEAEMVWGDLPRPKRDAAVNSFQKGTTRILLKQCAVHFGMDLSRASTMIRYSLPDRYEDLSQDQDRIVHPTKDMVTEPLLYIDLVCKDTVDEDVLAASRDKSIDARYFMSRIIDNYKARLVRKAGL